MGTHKATDPGNEGQPNNDPIAAPVEAASEGETNSGEAVANHLQAEIDRLKGERDQLVDRLARLQAEFENARKREARERADFRDFAVAGAVEQFLPVLDNFRLALRSEGSADQLRSGLHLIIKQMDEALRSLNVTPVESVGTPFAPRVHEAIENVERTD